VRGVEIHEGFLRGPSQIALLNDIREVTRRAPLFRPTTPSGKALSVRMTSAGAYGWYSDAQGYRYLSHHPTGSPWPEIPKSILAIWNELSGTTRAPECCLVNFYDNDARMGLHQDKDEADLSQPVVSISLGDDALFRIGNTTKGGSTESIWLRSGDVCVMGGEARRIYHGIDRIAPDTGTLLPRGGRINLTLRVVT
jgi:alkylated DNA repair protein (DNA oxidative demethylase)